MTLIRCRECKSQVSTQAERCTHCGTKVIDCSIQQPNCHWLESILALAMAGLLHNPAVVLAGAAAGVIVGRSHWGWMGTLGVALVTGTLLGVLVAMTARHPRGDRAEILLLYRGYLWYLLGRHRRAIRDFTELMERCPEWNCYWERGWAYRRLGDWQRAEQDFEEDRKRWGTSNSVTMTG